MAIVACMRNYDACEAKVIKAADAVSQELVEAVLYSFSKYRTEALQELPQERASPLEGPQNIKEMIENVKLELQDLAHKLGQSFVSGMAKSFAENMPFKGAEKQAALLLNQQAALLATLQPPIIDTILNRSQEKKLLTNSGLEIEEKEDINPKLKDEIQALEQALRNCPNNSIYATDIIYFQRCLWQSVTLRKRIWLYLFHMGNFFWNLAEAEKSRNNNEIIRMILWSAGAVFSGFELRKSASYRNILSFYLYTPEKFGLTIMKISLMAFFVLQYSFFKASELSHSAYVDKLLEKMLFSILGGTVISIVALTFLNRGYEQKIAKRQEDMAKYQQQLSTALASKKALLKEATTPLVRA